MILIESLRHITTGAGAVRIVGSQAESIITPDIARRAGEFLVSDAIRGQERGWPRVALNLPGLNMSGADRSLPVDEAAELGRRLVLAGVVTAAPPAASAARGGGDT